ncbi:hypothetical protein BH09ACT6_BH09ACT6_24060 [soil metagenome]
MTVGWLIVRGWRTHVPVVIGNAVVQAATTAPFATPAFSAGFVALAVVSLVSLVVSVVLEAAQAAASAEGTRYRPPSARLWAAGAVAVVVIAASAVVFAPLLVVTTTAALVVLPSIAGGTRGIRGTAGFSGFRTFAHTPVRAIGLTILTIATILVLWLGALISGFFITGAFSAALTWLVFGAVGVVLICAWTSLTRGFPAPSRA